MDSGGHEIVGGIADAPAVYIHDSHSHAVSVLRWVGGRARAIRVQAGGSRIVKKDSQAIKPRHVGGGRSEGRVRSHRLDVGSCRRQESGVFSPRTENVMD